MAFGGGIMMVHYAYYYLSSTVQSEGYIAQSFS